MKSSIFAVLLTLSFAAPIHAQPVYADQFVLNTGRCALKSDAGSPEGVVAGKVCDWYRNTTDGSLWLKISGTTNVGWELTLKGIGTAGTLAKWTSAGTLADSVVFESSGNLHLQPSGDIITNPLGKDILPNQGYDVNIGMLTKKYLSLHAAELWVETLVAQNTIATIGGRVLVAPTNILVVDLIDSATSIVVKYNNLFNTERVYMEADGKVEFMAITSSASGSAGAWTYTVTRNLDGTGANFWYAGDAILNTGVAGNGFIDIYSVRGIRAGTEIGPTIVGNVRNSLTYNDWSPRWAAGNLNGLYGYSSSIYGAAFGNEAATNVTVDATNGFRIRHGTTNKFDADILGNLSLAGDLTVGENGVVHSAGATSYLSPGTGFWIKGGPSPEFRVGNSTTSQIAYLNGVMSIGAEGSGVTNIDGGNIQTNTINVGAINATGFGSNLVKNGTFEGPTSSAALSGWSEDGNGTDNIQSCCGLNGPGSFLINQGDGFYGGATYTAFPVAIGRLYRVTISVYSPVFTSGYDVFIAECDEVTYVRRCRGQGTEIISAPDASMDSYYGVANGALIAGWQVFTITYSPTSNMRWASLSIRQATGSFADDVYGGLATEYAALHFDDIEVQEQIGPGHIVANSITAAQIAVGAIGTSELQDGAITAAKIIAGQITGTLIANGTVTSTNIAAATITSVQMAAGSIGTTQLAANAVTAAKILAGEINGTLIAGGTITTANIAANAITTALIAANTIVANDIAADEINAFHIAANSITTSELAADSVTSAKILAGEIQTTDLAADSITSAKIAAGEIQTSDLAADSVTADKINVTSLSAITADLGTVTAGLINGVTIIAGGAVHLDSNGISIDSGAGALYGYKFDASAGIGMYYGGTYVSIMNSNNQGVQLSAPGQALYVSSGGVSLTSLAGSGNRSVCVDGAGLLYAGSPGC